MGTFKTSDAAFLFLEGLAVAIRSLPWRLSKEQQEFRASQEVLNDRPSETGAVLSESHRYTISTVLYVIRVV